MLPSTICRRRRPATDAKFRAANAASAAALALAFNAQAFEIYTDYTPSKEVWNVTMVKVNPNRIDDYLEVKHIYINLSE